MEYLGPDAGPDELCDWIISINGTECIEDCEEEIFIGLEFLAEACYNCLSDETLDCADIFDDSGNDDWEDECRQYETEDECLAADCEWDDEEGCYRHDGGGDDGWDDSPCFDLGYQECIMTLECEWMSDNDNPNSWGMCVDAGNDDWGDTGDDCNPNMIDLSRACGKKRHFGQFPWND